MGSPLSASSICLGGKPVFMWLPDAAVLFYKWYIYQIKDRLILCEEKKRREKEKEKEKERQTVRSRQ
ncbi:hypothetical protein PUN28_012463 [Cardiocondyla obscurior]|uniref:ATP synthase F0 subunit 8 n=1 Tax=Cardiocondyla obscurior TaxID=286306 RepID=A0AAW2FHD3_9HYME